MRKSTEHDGIKLNAIAGTYVVTLGWDMAEHDCDGLMGFSVYRVDHTENEAYYLEGIKCFAETDPGFPSGASYPTDEQPVQSFQWADYTAKPGHEYSYTVAALGGTPSQLQVRRSAGLDITTESPESGDQDIYFNRGVAGSQAYVKRFGDRKPDKVPNRQAWIWLSRGLYEALCDFVESAIPGKHTLRIAAYEFHYPDFLRRLKDAIGRGVDIEVVYDGRKAKPGDTNRTAILAVDQAGGKKLADHCTERTKNSSYIAHNKFIVKLEDGNPQSVWTGGTNFSDGGIFGHSNVGHLIEDPDIAGLYLQYWDALAKDPEVDGDLEDTTERLTALPSMPPPNGISAIFSPRTKLDALNWYGELAKTATEGLFMTFAFGMHAVFQDVYRTSEAPFRLALLETATRPLKKGSKELLEEEQKIQELRNMPENTFAIGSLITSNKFDGWLKESLTGLNKNVRYVHNKFMLVDPLSDNPVVVAGSANFSAASTNHNDENMVVVAGNKRVADIYLGEFMRLYSHHAFRESLKWRKPDDSPKPLRVDKWWQDYFGDNERAVRRAFFSRPLSP